MRIALLLIAAVVLAADAPVVEYSDDRLTARLDKVPLESVIAAIGQASGAEIRGRVREPHEVTGDYDRVPLPEALHRLLAAQNFTLVYGNQGRLRTIKLLGGPQGPPPTLAVAAGSTPTTVPGASPAALADLMVRHPPVPVTGALAQALGTRSASLSQLLDAALHQQDAPVRAEAVRTGVRSLEQDPPLRDAIVSMVGTLDDPTLTMLLRNAAGDRTGELVGQLLGAMRTPELRKRALAIMPAIQAPN